MAKKAHDLYVIQVDQRRLVDVHADCLMETVNSPRSPVPLNYTEDVAIVPSQFKEDTYNVKKILGHRTHRRKLLFKVRWEGYTKDWDTEGPLKPSYRPTIRFGEITCRNTISSKPFTSLPTLVDRSHWRATEKALANMGIYYCLGKGGESQKRLETRRKREKENVHARRAPRLQKSPPERGGGYRMFTPPSTSLTAKGLRVLHTF